ncbi:hypothetical protein FOA52_012266 [Chlamydomonas sp. UWO 241]|nr:hypothetical protein FOA52_012266 [Chlamydomonas sp. UWO 241]
MASVKKQQLPTLATGPVPLLPLREQARLALVDLIDTRRGTKTLILDPAVSGPLSLLDVSLPELLAEHGVTKLVHLETRDDAEPWYAAGLASSDTRNVMYIVRATVENTMAVAAQIRAAVAAQAKRAGDQRRDYSVFFVPRRTVACDRVLEEEALLGDVAVGELPMDVVPLEDDVLSLELYTAFRDCVVDGDSGPLFLVARAITRLQATFGLIPRLQGKGPAAVAVRDMCIRMRRESPVLSAPSASTSSLISRAVIIDREVDVITPMMTQITFEGLIDEVTGIRNGTVPWVPKDKRQAGGGAAAGASASATAPRGPTTMINSTDPFYKRLSCCAFRLNRMEMGAPLPLTLTLPLILMLTLPLTLPLLPLPPLPLLLLLLLLLLLARDTCTLVVPHFVLSIPVARGANWFLAGGGRRMDEEEATAAAAERIAAAAEDGTSLPVRLATDVVRFLYGGTGRREPGDGGVVSASLLNAKPAVGGIGVEPRGGGVLRVLFTVAYDAVANTVVRWRHELRRCVDSTAVFNVLSDREEAQHRALWPAFLAAKAARKRAQFHRARLVVDGEREFRDLPYYISIQRLQHYARDAHKEYSELKSKDMTELKTFVKGLPKLMMLEKLSDIATPVAEQVKQQLFHDRLRHEIDIVEGYDTEAAVAFIEELMCRGAPVTEVLRMLVLLNECHQGLSKKHLDGLRCELLHTYGHEHLVTLAALERAGFVRPASAAGKASFKEMRKALRLTVPEEEDLAASGGPDGTDFNPSDISFLYKGYAPLSIRLVERALGPGGWTSVAEALTLLPGSHFDIAQTVDANGMPSERPYKAHMQQQQSAGPPGPRGSAVPTAAVGTSSSAASPPTTSSPLMGGSEGGVASEGVEVVMVVFLGGVTFSEISALRYLQSRPESKHRFLILTTSIVNGTTLLQTFIDPVTQAVGDCIGLA